MYKDLGVWIAIIVFIAAQFIEVTLFSVGGIPITLGKLIAGVFYPISLIFMKKLYLNRYMFFLAFLLLLSYTMAFFIRGNFSPAVIKAFTIVLIGFAGATVLYTALAIDCEKNFRRFAYTWIAFSVITAPITMLQTIGFFPLVTVPEQYIGYRKTIFGLYRGVGLKFDPNFQALMLVIGVVFALFYLKKVWLKLLAVIIILFLGILGTFSRMGLFLSLVSLVTYFLVKGTQKNRSLLKLFLEIISFGFIISTISLILYVWGPQSISEYLRDRVIDIGNGLDIIFSKGLTIPHGHLSSAETRALLAKAALMLALKNWTVGIGAFQTKSLLYEYIGIQNVAHNTYLELFLIGGIWGLLTILFYGLIIFYGVRCKNNCRFLTLQYNTSFALVVVFVLSGLFLSLTYNSVIWLPIVLALTIRKCAKILYQ